MDVVDHLEFEHEVVLRHLTVDDFDDLVAMQLRCFPGMHPWGRDQIESQVRTFPEGQLCIEIDGKLAASSCSLIVDFGQYSAWHDWKVIADGGYIRNHDPTGDTLYGIEIMVDPEFPGLNLARRLYDARKELCRERNLARIIIAGRLPGYSKHSDEMSVREYAEAVMNKSLVDPVMTTQVSNGFVLQGLIADYFPSDSESRGWAAFLEWINLDHRPGAKRRFHAVETVRIAVVQYQMRTIESFDDFARQCEYFIDVASDYKCDFVLFPEMITTQLMCLIEEMRPGMAARQLSQFTEDYLELFGRLAVKYDLNVIPGTHFVVEDDRLFNVAYLFGRNGAIGKQYKMHITPSERKWWGVEPGTRLEIHDTDCGKVAICICYDIEFPELARIAAAQGAHVIFVPFNTDTRQGYLRVRYCAQARCIENHQFVAIAGCTGNLPFVDNVDIHYAQSGIFTPADFSFARDGIAAEATPNIETILIHDVDVELARRHRSSGTTKNWYDRRKDVYRVLYKHDDQDWEA
ncbi:MAG: GNAT family N-acetyltransferase [Planctomycetota bacterium]|nr:MAG: GNAT family N-acetyltransferase [Planctomycetota bacterium]